MNRVLLVAAAGLLLLSPHPTRAQSGRPGGPAPTERGTAVVHLGPIGADTLPVLCHDAMRPELGFVTEMTDAEWAPRLELSLWPAEDTDHRLSMLLEDGGRRYGATFDFTPSHEGYFTVGAFAEPDDGTPGKNVYFTVSCGERLVRGG